jgi:hypothetical protein
VFSLFSINFILNLKIQYENDKPKLIPKSLSKDANSGKKPSAL